MFEGFTFEYLMNKMLSNIKPGVDKREGSIIWDAIAPCALEMASLFIYMDIILEESFADSASYMYLAKRAAERGITPHEATPAHLKAIFTPDTVAIPNGSRFNLGELNYYVYGTLTDGYEVICETAGEIGNTLFGKITPIEPIQGLQYGEVTELIIPGEDDEDEEVFRNRYFASFNNEAFGGNIADYKEKVNQIQGVGGVKVYPVFFGGGTVKLVIINSLFDVPSDDFIAQVQNDIDPVGHSGEGVGIAPIGHVVTVFGVGKTTVDIVLNITYQDGYIWDDIKPFAEAVIDEYLLELAKAWADSDSLIVRTSQIETRLLDIQGVVDIFDTQINGVASNFVIDTDFIPVRGDISG